MTEKRYCITVDVPSTSFFITAKNKEDALAKANEMLNDMTAQEIFDLINEREGYEYNIPEEEIEEWDAEKYVCPYCKGSLINTDIISSPFECRKCHVIFDREMVYNWRK